MPSQADALTLYNLLSNGQADTNLFPLFYQDVMNILGQKHWHSRLSTINFFANTSLVNLPGALLDILTVFYGGELISRLTLRQMFTLNPAWRTVSGTPLVYTIEGEESKTMEVYPSAATLTTGTILYSEDRTNSLSYLTLPIALKCLAREFVRESDHADVNFATFCDQIADVLFGMMETRDNQLVPVIMTPLQLPGLTDSQSECQDLVAFISDGKADLTIFPMLYADTMAILGLDLWHTTTANPAFTQAISTVNLPTTLLDLIAMISPTGIYMSHLELREVEVLNYGWRNSTGEPISYTTQAEAKKTIEVYPRPALTGTGTAIYAELRADSLPYLTLPIALLILERDFSRRPEQADRDYADICGALGRYLLEQLATSDNKQVHYPESDEEMKAVLKAS